MKFLQPFRKMDYCTTITVPYYVKYCLFEFHNFSEKKLGKFEFVANFKKISIEDQSRSRSKAEIRKSRWSLISIVSARKTKMLTF